MNKTAVIEGLKQVARTALIAVVPILIAQLQNGDGIDWRVIGTTAAIAVLMGIDKMLHKMDTGIGGNGLTAF